MHKHACANICIYIQFDGFQANTGYDFNKFNKQETLAKHL